MGKFIVRVPATTANLGPGFDVMGLALDLWNEAEFSLEGEGVRVEVEGEGKNELHEDENNLVAKAVFWIYDAAGKDAPSNLLIQCRNAIPLSSGLGSSAAAVLTGLLGGNALLRNPLAEKKLLALAVEMEGHADNAAAALYGGLVLVVGDGDDLIVKTIQVSSWKVVALVPNVPLSTKESRQKLPKMYSREAVVFNLGHSAMVVAALREGNVELLASVMDDKIHQPTRLELIPGAQKAIEAANAMGAAAALSGAGPGVVGFVMDGGDKLAERMQAAFKVEGVQARSFVLSVADTGAEVVG